jgi:hypothetical protein
MARAMSLGMLVVHDHQRRDQPALSALLLFGGDSLKRYLHATGDRATPNSNHIAFCT